MKRVILVIRDGWGYRKEKINNTIAHADTPNDDCLRANYPWTLLDASGQAVGLTDGYQGNSEVGHLTIGSGRIVDQSLVRINKSIQDGSFFKKIEFLEAIENCRKNKSRLHIIGLLQKEGVHSHIDHLLALIELCKREKFGNFFIHIITDGRDAPPTRGKEYLKELSDQDKIVTLSGRYYAMDRDKRWDRTKKAYDAVVEGYSDKEFTDPVRFIQEEYDRAMTDEFIQPAIRKGYQGIRDRDSVIFYNLRTDRPRQLTQAMIEPDFDQWPREKKEIFFVAMTDYYQGMNGEVVFKTEELKNILGEVVSQKGLRQLRISETEKYAHVTFFFNGQREKPFLNEERILIPSPKDVATYDEKPEMSVYEIRDRLIPEISSLKYDLIVVNLVNVDMVGHSGDFEKTKLAVEAVDDIVGQIVEAGKSHYDMIITADHGNGEDQGAERITSHTTNPVPLILVSKDKKRLRRGGLRDIAPTILELLGIEKPVEMDGRSLIKRGVYERIKLLYNGIIKK